MNIVSNISFDKRKFSSITCLKVKKTKGVKDEKWNRFQFVSYWLQWVFRTVASKS